MSGFLLDTNCVSELVRIRPEPRVVEWMEAADERLLSLSVLTLGEIRKGLAGISQGKRRTRLEAWLETDLQARFSGRILPIDWPIADRWGLIAAQAKSEGFSLPIVDCWPRQPLTTISPWFRETPAISEEHTCRSSILGKNESEFLIRASSDGHGRRLLKFLGAARIHSQSSCLRLPIRPNLLLRLSDQLFCGYQLGFTKCVMGISQSEHNSRIHNPPLLSDTLNQSPDVLRHRLSRDL
jgi:toxin FitB